MIISIAKRLTLLWIVLAASPALSEGQTNTGEISGSLRDAQGGVLPGATVQAEHVESGTRTERVTDEHGRYLLPSLRIGAYVVSVELVDLAVAKTWTTAGGRQLELRWEIFNTLNRTNFDLPNRIFGTDNFGRIFSAKNPREMQFGAKVTF